jgi:hypothetical protein
MVSLLLDRLNPTHHNYLSALFKPASLKLTLLQAFNISQWSTFRTSPLRLLHSSPSH